MKIHPVKKYPMPSYPSLMDVQNHPELLKKLPKRWQNNRAVMAAILALTTISASGCSKELTKSAAVSENEQSTTAAVTEKKQETTMAPKSHMAAPIFYHGEGTGSLGCVMVAPPVFLSEAEALAIIKNEAAAAGVRLEDTPDAYSAKPGTTEDSYTKKQITLGTAVPLDSCDKGKNIAVSFASMNESRVENGTTVESFYAKRRAEQAVDGWKEANVPYVVGTFYDPGVNINAIKDEIGNLYSDNEKERKEKQEAYEAKAKAQLEKDLKAQVKDFIGWLKGQGVI